MTLSAPPRSDREAVANLLLRSGGAPLPDDVVASLIEASVSQRLGEASELTLRLSTAESAEAPLAWLDGDLFRPGTDLEAEMGYGGARAPLFAGEVVRLDLDVTQGSRFVMTVTAYDVLHRLGRGQKSATYENGTVGDVVQRIAQRHHVRADVLESAVDPVNRSLIQENESDLQFLLSLADEVGYELVVDGRNLVFRPSSFRDSPRLTLDAGQELIELSAQLSVSGQYGAVELRAYDSDAKITIVATADNGAGSSDALFGDARTVVVDAGVTTQAQATARANAALQRMQCGYIDARGTCFGRPELVAGIVVEIANLGARFSGRYYVTAATHTITTNKGYRTRFELQGGPR